MILWSIDLVSLALKLCDSRHQLGDGGGDVGQLDDHPLGGLGELPKPGQVVRLPLLGRQAVGEGGQDPENLSGNLDFQAKFKIRSEPAGDRDVPLLEADPHGCGEPLEHRKEGVGGQHRRLVSHCVDDLGHSPTL